MGWSVEARKMALQGYRWPKSLAPFAGPDKLLPPARSWWRRNGTGSRRSGHLPFSECLTNRSRLGHGQPASTVCRASRPSTLSVRTRSRLALVSFRVQPRGPLRSRGIRSAATQPACSPRERVLGDAAGGAKVSGRSSQKRPRPSACWPLKMSSTVSAPRVALHPRVRTVQDVAHRPCGALEDVQGCCSPCQLVGPCRRRELPRSQPFARLRRELARTARRPDGGRGGGQREPGQQSASCFSAWRRVSTPGPESGPRCGIQRRGGWSNDAIPFLRQQRYAVRLRVRRQTGRTFSGPARSRGDGSSALLVGWRKNHPWGIGAGQRPDVSLFRLARSSSLRSPGGRDADRGCVGMRRCSSGRAGKVRSPGRL
jgi:hypothetical protein